MLRGGYGASIHPWRQPRQGLRGLEWRYGLPTQALEVLEVLTVGLILKQASFPEPP